MVIVKDADDELLFGKWFGCDDLVVTSNVPITPTAVPDTDYPVITRESNPVKLKSVKSNPINLKSAKSVKKKRKASKYTKEYYIQTLIDVIGSEQATSLLSQYKQIGMNLDNLPMKQVWLLQDEYLVGVYVNYPTISNNAFKYFFSIGAARFSSYIKNSGVRRSTKR